VRIHVLQEEVFKREGFGDVFLMNPLRKKLASVMIGTAYEEIGKLGKNSPYLKALKGVDVDKILAEDVSRICEDISMGEIMKILPLVAKLKIACQEDEHKALKCEIKEIALRVVERVEFKGGSLKLPASCRDLLLEL
jgi:hypothetical protein